MSLQLNKPFVIDGKGHLLGRLASVVAKQLITGQQVIVVRAELLNISGSFFRNKLRYEAFLHKRHLVNPKKLGPFHQRAPSRIFKRAVRGMLPHKTARGAAAFHKLKVYEGVPTALECRKRVVVPDALRVLRLKPGRKWATLGRISSEYGWTHGDTIDQLETKRKVKQQAFFERKIASQKRYAAAANAAAAQIAPINEQLAQFGY